MKKAVSIVLGSILLLAAAPAFAMSGYSNYGYGMNMPSYNYQYTEAPSYFSYMPQTSYYAPQQYSYDYSYMYQQPQQQYSYYPQQQYSYQNYYSQPSYYSPMTYSQPSYYQAPAPMRYGSLSSPVSCFTDFVNNVEYCY